jgi:hypothetical protein
MAIICRNYKLLFIMSPRTACTAIGEVLCKQFGGEYLPNDDIIDNKGFIRIQKKHSTLKELIKNNMLSQEEASSLLKFTCVRNPFDSLVSLYIKKKYKYDPLLLDQSSWVYRLPGYVEDMEFCKNHSFDSWILKNCSKKLIKRLIGFKPSLYHYYTDGVDIVMRYENLDKDFQNVLEKVGIKYKVKIPSVNKTNERTNSDYCSYYSLLSKMIVKFAFSDDFKSYGY